MLWAGKAAIIDVATAEAALAPRRGSGYRALAGRDREHQRYPLPTLRAVDKTVAREHRPERCSVLLRNESDCERWSQSSMSAVKRTST